MKEYILNCPNALRNSKKELTISTKFIYDTLADALKHKELCDIWDREQGKEPTTYIEEREREEE